MKNVLRFLFDLYSVVPYLFFIVFVLIVSVTAIADGALVINDTTMDILPLAVLALACVAGIFLFPLVATSLLVYNWRKWKKLAYPLLSYGLYLAGVVLAGHMGWWTD